MIIQSQGLFVFQMTFDLWPFNLLCLSGALYIWRLLVRVLKFTVWCVTWPWPVPWPCICVGHQSEYYYSSDLALPFVTLPFYIMTVTLYICRSPVRVLPFTVGVIRWCLVTLPFNLWPWPWPCICRSPVRILPFTVGVIRCFWWPRPSTCDLDLLYHDLDLV